MHLVDAKGILSAQNGMNLYRGCVHGCIYCDSRSRCYHIEHPFEDVEVKRNALTLLDEALRKRRRRCMLSTGAMTDPYIPEEEVFGLTSGAMRLALRLHGSDQIGARSARPAAHSGAERAHPLRGADDAHHL